MNAPVKTPPRIVRLHTADNVVVAVDTLDKGAVIEGATVAERVPRGHKLAVVAFGQ